MKKLKYKENIRNILNYDFYKNFYKGEKFFQLLKNSKKISLKQENSKNI